MTVKFTVTFFGGIGELTILLFRAGEKIGEDIVFPSSGSQSIDLSAGFYIISLTGNSAPGGTDFEMNVRTIPDTPDHLKPGPVAKMYILNI